MNPGARQSLISIQCRKKEDFRDWIDFLQNGVIHIRNAISCCSNKLKELEGRYTVQVNEDNMSKAQQRRNKRSEPVRDIEELALEFVY